MPEGAILIHRGHGHDVIVVVVGILDPGKLLLFQIVQASDGLGFLLRRGQCRQEDREDPDESSFRDDRVSDTATFLPVNRERRGPSKG